MFIWGLFYPKFVHPNVWKEPGDEARIERSISTDIPAALDYLEGELPDAGYLFGAIGLADIAIASFFRNGAMWASKSIRTVGQRPRDLSTKVLSHPAFEKLHRLEQIQLSTSIQGRRQALLDAGAKLTSETYGEREPRKGIMRL